MIKDSGVSKEKNVLKPYVCIDAYKPVENPDEWNPCPDCGLVPRTWEFNNGRFTACGCGENQYNHPGVSAESVMSVYERTGSCSEYKSDDLRDNWNHWTKTREHLFDPKNIPEQEGRW